MSDTAGSGYLIKPLDAANRRGVLVLHSWWGLTPFFRRLCDRLAEVGYVALAPDLLALPNFILTPHVGWASGEAMQVLADQLTDNIEAYVRGGFVNRVV